MEISYWQSRWKANKLGWHLDQVNPLLVEYWQKLNLAPGRWVLVPMCGKSRDMIWLAEQDLRVIGVEISKIAARQFFEEHSLSYETSPKGAFTIYDAGQIQFWQGDFFKLTARLLPGIDAIYDRAALVSQPAERRPSYAQKINECTADARSMLLSTFEYEQQEMNGPPFAVFEDEVRNYYSGRFEIRLLHEESLLDRVPKFRRRGLQSYLREKVFLLQTRS